jgi:hypothetical protein
MSAFYHKQTWHSKNAMSTLLPKADIRNVWDYGPNRLSSARLAQEAEGAVLNAHTFLESLNP